jgi:hypothetical protein
MSDHTIFTDEGDPVEWTSHSGYPAIHVPRYPHTENFGSIESDMLVEAEAVFAEDFDFRGVSHD